MIIHIFNLHFINEKILNGDIMKRTVLFAIITFVFIFTNTSYSQIYGVKAGINLANMNLNTELGYDDINRSYDMKIGYQVGATVEFPIDDMFAFESGLFLANKGYQANAENSENNAKGTVSLTYLQIPITGKMYYNMDKVTLYGILGPYLSYGIFGSDDFKTNGNEVTFGSGTNETSPFDIGLLIGIGAVYDQFEVGLSYEYGFSNALNSSDEISLTHRVVSITGAYKFNLPKEWK